MDTVWQVSRHPANPIIRPDMPGLSGEEAANINGPSLIRVPAWIAEPLGRYYLYFAHHGGKYIRLAYADAVEGPWTIHAPGALRLEQTAALGHIASPDVHIDEDRRQIRMYFHGKQDGQPPQVSYVATSADGLRFVASPAVLGPFYFRVWQHNGWHYAIAKDLNESGVMLRSRDGFTPFERGPAIIPRMRHAAVLVEGDDLWVFFTRIGDAPESVLVARMAMTGDWRQWQPGVESLVLAPEAEYEGGLLPVEASRAGAVSGAVCQLRDPSVFVEGDDAWLLYSVAGEQGIALGQLRRG